MGWFLNDSGKCQRELKETVGHFSLAHLIIIYVCVYFFVLFFTSVVAAQLCAPSGGLFYHFSPPLCCRWWVAAKPHTAVCSHLTKHRNRNTHLTQRCWRHIPCLFQACVGTNLTLKGTFVWGLAQCLGDMKQSLVQFGQAYFASVKQQCLRCKVFKWRSLLSQITWIQAIFSTFKNELRLQLQRCKPCVVLQTWALPYSTSRTWAHLVICRGRLS